MKYSERVHEVQSIIKRLQACEDVDDAIRMYEEATEHIRACEKKIEAAQGRFNELSVVDNKETAN